MKLNHVTYSAELCVRNYSVGQSPQQSSSVQNARIPENPPEEQQSCAGWAERQAEVLGPARVEGAPWEEEEEAEVEEVLLEVHASSAASDHLQNHFMYSSSHHSLSPSGV